MSTPDLNLLITLDVLLQEGSVAKAARRLRLSPSAMSRSLTRLRETTGDPLLVRAGRSLVPTPRALELRDRVNRLLPEAIAILRPSQQLNLQQLDRTFTVRTSAGFVENFGPALIALIARQAPGVRLDFIQKLNKDSTPLRDGSVDLETGVVGKAASPEVRLQALFRDRIVGVVRAGHELSKGTVTLAAYTAARHVAISRSGIDKRPIDRALDAIGLERNIVTVVSDFSTALALARGTELIASVPERHTGILRDGMHSFTLPVETPEVTVCMLWHPRLDADPAHRWLRAQIREVCGNAP